EACDDGNLNNGDGCNNLCEREYICGNGVLEQGENCDDSNTISGDGCSSDCQTIEGGGALCGNGIWETGEACDDGNLNNGDGCSSSCQIQSTCGNGIAEVGEACDDGNLENNDGCDETCQFEPTTEVVLPIIGGGSGSGCSLNTLPGKPNLGAWFLLIALSLLFTLSLRGRSAK
ncbi:MAG: DUF4215 domain-containing protein, partial [Deltaproteobacteria bacterium]|nr:DUF4215 domain-containing protein [Deltaproteobacteria bacterium]